MENKGKKQIKRIGIDARFYGPGKGLGRYTKEIVDRILKLDKDNKYVIFLDPDSFDLFKTDNPRVKKVLVRARWYSLLEQIMVPYLILKENLNFVHFLHFNVPLHCPVKYLVTIHDLILTKFPTPRASTLSPLLYKIKHLGYKIIIRSGIKNAQKVIAVSKFTKQEIIDQFKIKQDKIVVTYEGVSNDLLGSKMGDRSIKKRYNIKGPYLLYVGNAYPHKNLENLVMVFSKIREKYSDLNLVLVGKEDYFYRRLKQRVENDNFTNIIFTGYVADQDLVNFYKNALLYVFPSFCEGFGLPPLEAMTQGLPVVSSAKTCLPEILENAACYFNPEDENDIFEKITKLIQDKELREELRIKGYAQIKKYSWDKCAKETFNIYKII